MLGEIGGLRLGEAPVRDIFGEADHRDHSAVHVEDRSIDHERAHDIAVATPHEEVAFPSGAAGNRRHDLRGEVALLQRHEHLADRPTEYFCFAPAVQLLRVPVPELDATFGIGDDDGARQNIDHVALA
jgi:hypothetical protein